MAKHKPSAADYKAAPANENPSTIENTEVLDETSSDNSDAGAGDTSSDIPDHTSGVDQADEMSQQPEEQTDSTASGEAAEKEQPQTQAEESFEDSLGQSDAQTANAVEQAVSESEASQPVDEAIISEPIVGQSNATRELTCGLDALSEWLRDHVNKLLATGSPMTRITLMELLDYLYEMAPGKPVEEARGKQHQQRLYASLQNILNNGAQDYRLFLEVFVCIVNELKVVNVFDTRYITRFNPASSLGAVEWDSFVAFIETIKGTDWNAAVSAVGFPDEALVFLSEEGQERIKTHFSV